MGHDYVKSPLIYKLTSLIIVHHLNIYIQITMKHVYVTVVAKIYYRCVTKCLYVHYTSRGMLSINNH